MEGMVAKWYAVNTGKTLDEFTKLALRIGSQLPPGSTVLEVAPGPGYFSIELAKLGPYSIAGLDISHTFVELARKKAAKAGVHVDFRQGNASQMPFANDTLDFLLCRAAFKNFGQPVRALQEMCRVLKGGRHGLEHRQHNSDEARFPDDAAQECLHQGAVSAHVGAGHLS
jgi:ubiquinone/menaquinone biosynthesis C-methylase UbiE